MSTFGEPSEEVLKNCKYAKYKAAYIHNCLKNGETPVAGPMTNDESDEELGAVGGADPSQPQAPNAGFYLPPTKYTPDPSQLPPGLLMLFKMQIDDNSNGFLANFTPTDPFKHMRAPSPPKEPEKQPGGFVPYYAPETPSNPNQSPTKIQQAYGNVHLTADQLIKAQKYAKWAGSALTYEDVQTAIMNLKFALQLLETGHDPNGH